MTGSPCGVLRAIGVQHVSSQFSVVSRPAPDGPRNFGEKSWLGLEVVNDPHIRIRVLQCMTRWRPASYPASAVRPRDTPRSERNSVASGGPRGRRSARKPSR